MTRLVARAALGALFGFVLPAAHLTSAHASLAAPTTACTDTWTNAAGGDWSAPGNWSAGLPTTSSDVCITTPGSYTVTVEGTVAIDALVVGSGTTGDAETLQLTDLGCGGGSSLRTTSATLNDLIAPTGTIDLTSTCSGGDSAGLTVTGSSLPLVVNGTLKVDAGTGGARSINGPVTVSGGGGKASINAMTTYGSPSTPDTWDNLGVLTIGDSSSLQVNNGAGVTFDDDAGGTISTTGSATTGVLYLQAGNTFVQGAGSVTGGPVYVENSALSFAGSGGNAVIDVRGPNGTVSGDIGSADTLNIQAVRGCESATETTPASFTNNGLIDLTSTTTTGCTSGPAAAALAFTDGGSPSTLTNLGTLQTDVGAGGTRTIVGNVQNGNGAVETVNINAPTNYTPTEAVTASPPQTIAGTFDNLGKVNLNAPLTVTGASATPTAAFIDDTGGSISATGTGQLGVTGPDQYTQGTGTTSGNPVVVTSGTTMFAANGGAATILAEGQGSTLTGTVNSGQTYQVEGVGAGGSAATVNLSGNVTDNGTIDLTAQAINGAQDTLIAPNGTTLTVSSSGVLQSDAGTGGARTLIGAITIQSGGQVNINVGTTWSTGTFTNNGSVKIGDALSFLVQKTAPRSTFTNGATGNIATSSNPNKGNLFVIGDVFDEAGTTTGGPVFVQNAYLNYIGTGASSINSWGTTKLGGNLGQGQTLTVQAVGCVTDSNLTAPRNFDIFGSLILTSTNCHGGSASLTMTTATKNFVTIETTGSLTWVVGAGGTRTITGKVVNKGTVGPSGVSPLTITGTFTQSSTGTFQTAVSATNADTVAVSATATLAGKLVAVPISGFTPGHGTSWAGIVTATRIFHAFASTTGPGGTWTSSVTSGSVNLQYP